MGRSLKLTIKAQLALLLSITLGASIWFYGLVGTRLVVADKESYVFDYSLSQTQAAALSIQMGIESAVSICKLVGSAGTLSLSKEHLNQLNSDFEAEAKEHWLSELEIFRADGGGQLKLLSHLGTDAENLVSVASQMGWNTKDWIAAPANQIKIGKVSGGFLPIAGTIAVMGRNREVFIALLKMPSSLFQGSARDMTLHLLDSSGAVLAKHLGGEGDLARTDWVTLEKPVLGGTFASGVLESSDHGTDFILGYTRLFDGKLIVVSAISKAVAYTASRQLIWRTALLGLGTLLIALGFGLFLTRGLTMRLRDLWGATLKISQGDYSARINPKGLIKDEVTDLATSFNQMSEKITDAREKLEDYAKNLEQKVKDRTADLNYANRLLRSILESLGQGFLIFGKDRKCLPVYSKACNVLLETAPSGPSEKAVTDVLRLSKDEAETFDSWCSSVFEELLPFEDLVGLGPTQYAHTQGKKIDLEFHSMPEETGKGISGLVMVASDRTAQFEAQKAAENEREHAKAILKLARDREHFVAFIENANQLFKQMRADLEGKEIQSLMRCLHTLKGSAATFSVTEVKELAHGYETQLIQSKADSESALSQTLKFFKREAIQNLEEALKKFFNENREIIGREYGDTQRKTEIPISELLAFSDSFPAKSELKERFLQQFVKEPVQKSFLEYIETVQEVARAQGKQVAELEFSGGDLRIMPDAYRELFPTFVHAFRNAVDHGIEPASEREKSGKPGEGRIRVSFSRETSGGHPWLVIQVRDDGRGISPDAIRKKLAGKGSESDAEVIQHVFDSGLSTREVVTDVSGRGVGLDAILSAAKKLGGSARVSSEIGKGTTLTVRVPDLDPSRPSGSREKAA